MGIYKVEAILDHKTSHNPSFKNASVSGWKVPACQDERCQRVRMKGASVSGWKERLEQVWKKTHLNAAKYLPVPQEQVPRGLAFNRLSCQLSPQMQHTSIEKQLWSKLVVNARTTISVCCLVSHSGDLCAWWHALFLVEVHIALMLTIRSSATKHLLHIQPPLLQEHIEWNLAYLYALPYMLCTNFHFQRLALGIFSVIFCFCCTTFNSSTKHSHFTFHWGQGQNNQAEFGGIIWHH